MRALIAALLALRADSFHASTRQRSAAARAIIPERVPLDILYEDGDVIVLDNFRVGHARNPWDGSRRELYAAWTA